MLIANFPIIFAVEPEISWKLLAQVLKHKRAQLTTKTLKSKTNKAKREEEIEMLTGIFLSGILRKIVCLVITSCFLVLNQGNIVKSYHNTTSELSALLNMFTLCYFDSLLK